MRPLSTLSPSAASSAGTTVTEPIIATATTMIAPMPSEVNVRSPANSMPAMATMTVKPETSTARPEVAAAICTASSFPAPARLLLAFTTQVEERVVDADGQADEQDDRADHVVHRHDLAGQGDEAERRHHGGQPQQQRDARGDERAEGEHEDDRA